MQPQTMAVTANNSAAAAAMEEHAAAAAAMLRLLASERRLIVLCTLIAEGESPVGRQAGDVAAPGEIARGRAGRDAPRGYHDSLQDRRPAGRPVDDDPA